MRTNAILRAYLLGFIQNIKKGISIIIDKFPDSLSYLTYINC